MRRVKELDQGGFGRVYEAVNDQGVPVALKEFAPYITVGGADEAVDKARQRFVRETRIQASIDHPHIMPVLESNLEAEPPWFTMPLADERLTDLIDATRPIVNLDIVMQLLSGLEELHRLGFIHRDVKPHNALRVGGKWVLCDLGFAIPNDPARTAVTSTASGWGTREYQAPELLDDFRGASHLADIYSFGCLLHDWADGGRRIPYNRCTTQGPLAAVIEKCTEGEPSARFQTVDALRTALSIVLSAPPNAPTTGEAKEWVRILREEPTRLSADGWGRLIRRIETSYGDPDADGLLAAIHTDQLTALQAASPVGFQRVVPTIARWIRDGTFDFSYCDILGARLRAVYNLGGTREKAEATIAALYLGYSHNRWSVMRAFMTFAGATIDADLADRLMIEVLANGEAVKRRIERTVDVLETDISRLHPKVLEAMSRV